MNHEHDHVKVFLHGLLAEVEESEYWLHAGRVWIHLGRPDAVKKETGELKGIFISIVVNTKTKSQIAKR